MAYAILAITYVAEAGPPPCSATSVRLSINNTTGAQPNILGGNVAVAGVFGPSGNLGTTIRVNVKPGSESWDAVTFGDRDDNNINEYISIGAIPDSSGAATIQYETLLTGYGDAASVVNDVITPYACGTSWGCPAGSTQCNVYNYYPYLYSGQTQRMDMGLSQVTDANFVAKAALTEQQIERFFIVNSAYLAHFYLDTTNPGNGGWYDPSASGVSDQFAQGYKTYCPYLDDNNDPICPVPGDQGTLAAQLVANAADVNNINPEVILTTLEKEYGVTLIRHEPSEAALNFAMGCGGSTDFANQLSCGAAALSSDYTSSLGHYSGTTPYFFPVSRAHVDRSIQYPYNSTANCNGKKSLNPGCDLVGFWMSNAATEAQYHYTPFLQTSEAGGGVFSFEKYWFLFQSHGWYQ